MTSKEYWRRREYKNLLKSKNRDEKFVKERIAYIYNSLLRNINKEIQGQITRFSDSQGISINEARKRIEKADVEDYKYLAKTYVKDKDFSQKASREMKLYNITMRLNRLEMLNQMVRLHIIGTGSKVENELQDHLIKGSIDEYKRQASILGLNVNQTGIERRARFIVSQDYHNAHFSDRVWRDTRELSRRIERNIESVVIQGKNPREFAKKLRDLVSKDIKNITNATERLAYTESGRVWIQTQMEAYKDGGYEYLEIMTEPTACRHCSPHNGDIVKISEAVEGDNIPLWHPRCRCTTVAYFDDKNSDKSYNLEDMGYNKNEDKPLKISPNSSLEIINRVKNCEIILKSNRGHYEKHVSGTKQYNNYLKNRKERGWGPQNRLTISEDKVQEIINNFHGRGIIYHGKNNLNKWFEEVNVGRNIGYYYLKGVGYPTSKIRIYYGKKGTHIVPIRGDDFD